MIIQSFFTQEGVPVEGLSPTIRIRETDTGNLVVDDAAVSEIGDGMYFFDFTAVDPLKSYSIRVDAGDSLDAWERYAFAGIGKNEGSVKLTDVHRFHGLDKDAKVEVTNDTTTVSTPDGQTIHIGQTHSDDGEKTVIQRNE